MATQEWTSGLFGCFSDIGSCCLATFVPCVLLGQNAEGITNGMEKCTGPCCLYTVVQAFVGLGCLISYGYRTKLRQKYGLKEEPCSDLIVHCCCGCCALAQEAREIKARPQAPWPPAAAPQVVIVQQVVQQ